MKLKKLISLCVFGLCLVSCTSKKYIVTFNSNGGSRIDPQEVNEGDKLVKPDDPTKLGYDFVEWTYNDEPWVFSSRGVYEDMTLYANWSLIHYNIYYNLNGGTQNSLNKLSFTINDEVVLYTPSKKNCSFVGWKEHNNLIERIPRGTTTDVYLEAVWEIVAYDATFLNYDNSLLGVETVRVGEIAQPSFNPIREEDENYSYIFNGWSPELAPLYSDQTYKANFLESEEGECIYGIDNNTKTSYVRDFKFNNKKSYRILDYYNGFPVTATQQCNATNVEYIIYPNTIKTIGAYGFGNANKVESIILSSSLERIEYSAFQNCWVLESITFPKTLKYLGHWAFANAYKLSSITFEGTVDEWKSIEFESDFGNKWISGSITNVVHCINGDANLYY